MFPKNLRANTESPKPLVFWYDHGWIVMLLKVYVMEQSAISPEVLHVDEERREAEKEESAMG